MVIICQDVIVLIVELNEFIKIILFPMAQNDERNVGGGEENKNVRITLLPSDFEKEIKKFESLKPFLRNVEN